MGNHDAGRAMVITAVALKKANPEMPPLEILDAACEPYRNTDAEFDDDTFHGEPFAKIIQEAFAPNLEFGDGTDADGYWLLEDEFYDLVISPFRKRYNLW